MGRINQYPKASEINDNDTLLGVVGGTTKQVTKDILLSGVTKDIGNTTIAGKKAGKLITVDNSSNNRLPEITAYGKSVQDTYKGINLVDLSTPTLLDKVTNYTFDNETGLVKFDYNGNYARAHFRDDTLAGKTLYLYLKNKTNTNESATVCGVDIMYKKAGESNFSYLTMNQPQYIIPSDATEITIRVLGNNSNTALSGTFSANIMFSSEPTDTYEPFVGGEASPNPSYPQDITSVADDKNLVVKSVGRNVATYDSNLATNSDNELFYNNTVASGVAKVNGNEKWYIHCNNHSLLNGGFVRLFFTKEYPKVGVSVVSRLNISKNEVITTPEDAEYLVICALSTEITLEKSISALAEIMVAKSDVAIPYEPYVSTESTLTLADSLRGIPVASGGNYVDEDGQAWICDTLEKYADGTGKLTQRVGKIVFNGSEAWSKSSSVEGRYIYTSLKTTAHQNMLCTQFIVSTKITTELNKCVYDTNGNFFVNTSFATLAEWKAHLSSKPMEVICELAEYVETDLSAKQMKELEKLQTFEPYTTVMTDDTGDIAIKYFKNTDSGYIVGSLNDRISNLVSLLRTNGVI